MSLSEPDGAGSRQLDPLPSSIVTRVGGRDEPNGYTERILRRRRLIKAGA